MKDKTILVVEDDVMLNKGICFNLREDGFICESAFSLKETYDKLKSCKTNMIILDVNLPDGSGFELCKDIRQTLDIPILFLTACDMEIDIVTGFKLGGDDYITKPFSLMVLRERILALFRRYKPIDVEDDIIIIDNLKFNFDEMTVSKSENNIILTPTEYKLLKVLVENRGKILTRRVLLENLWDKDCDFVDEHALTVNINRLRAKIEENPSNPKYIKTVYGMGYIWAEV